MASTAACVPSTFSPTLFGAEILSVQAAIVTDYSVYVDANYLRTQPSIDVQNVTFCNVTVTYTHPGHNDTVIAEAWLPTEWNGRFQAVGGGGWSTGRFDFAYYEMAGAIGTGYATITTDAGLGNTSDPSPWALLSPGNVNLYLLQNFGTTSLGDEAVIGKSLIKSYYGTGPSYSYWNGCSTGGRQGLTLAQRYPDAYDGIVAGAPVIFWTMIALSNIWPQVYMKWTNQYPYGCELDAITEAAVTQCDGLDGVVDGLISDPDLCLAVFDPFKLVGKTISNCTETGGEVKISTAAANVANATWHGVETAEGKPVWYGVNVGAELTYLAGTNCSSGECVGNPSVYGYDYFRLFTQKDPDFNPDDITHESFDQMGRLGHQEYRSLMDFDDPDLYAFKKLGNKLITFHGLADFLIPPKDTEHYYTQVAELFPDVSDFHRLFTIPGLSHCNGGSGGMPSGLFEQLRAWVENGTAPEHSSMNFTAPDGSNQTRILCPYPQTALYDRNCGDSATFDCWSCVDVTTPGLSLNSS